MFSPMKIILLILVAGAVFIAARMFRKNTGDGGNLGKRDANDRVKGEARSTDLVECPKCGTFAANLEDHHCRD